LPEEFLVFEDLDIYGFIIHKYPTISGLVTFKSSIDPDKVNILIGIFSNLFIYIEI